MRNPTSIGPAQVSPIGTTLERHLLDRQRRMPEATGDFTGLFQQISLAAKIIGSRVSKAGLSGILGRTGTTNVQGEQVQKLDDFANNTIVSTVEAGGHVCVMGSEEVEEPIRDSAAVSAGQVRAAVRSARRLRQHRHQRIDRNDLFDSPSPHAGWRSRNA